VKTENQPTVKTTNTQTRTKFNWDWINLSSFSKSISKIRGKIPTSQNFERGEAVELSLVECSDRSLHRADQVGFDLVNYFGDTIEVKVARIINSKKDNETFNQSNFVIKNWQGKMADYCDSMKADIYVVVSYEDMKACFVYPEELRIEGDGKASVSARFYPDPERTVDLKLDESVEGTYWEDLKNYKMRLLTK